jgi:AcrR family transcriptional regulator
MAAVTEPAESPEDATAEAPAAPAADAPAPVIAQGRELRARGRRTMQRLLDAGAAVFAEKGYHAARVDDVVKKAKTSHGTFYLYFASKEDLFRALAISVATEMAALAGDFPPIVPGPDGRAALRTWLGRFNDLYETSGAVIRTWTEAEMSDSEFGRIGGDLVIEFTARIAARIRPAGPDLDPQVAAMALVALVERTCYYRATGTLRTGRDTMLDTLADAVQHGVCGSIPA